MSAQHDHKSLCIRCNSYVFGEHQSDCPEARIHTATAWKTVPCGCIERGEQAQECSIHGEVAMLRDRIKDLTSERDNADAGWQMTAEAYGDVTAKLERVAELLGKGDVLRVLEFLVQNNYRLHQRYTSDNDYPTQDDVEKARDAVKAAIKGSR
jgi:hypothetical protein